MIEIIDKPRFSIQLVSFFDPDNVELAKAVSSLYQNFNNCVEYAMDIAMYLFTNYRLDVIRAIEVVEITCFELLYDEYVDEWELSQDEAETTITGMSLLVTDLYPVVLAYANYLKTIGANLVWIMDNLEDSRWVRDGEGEAEEIYLIAEPPTDS